MPRKFLLVTLLCSLLYLPVEALDKGRLKVARAKIEKGQILLKKQEYEMAEKNYRAAIELSPEIPTGYLGLGAALVAQEKFQMAIEVLATAEQRFVEWELLMTAADLQRQQIVARQLQRIQDAAAAAAATRPNARGDSRTPQEIAQQNQNNISKEQFLLRDRWALEGIGSIPPQVFYLEGIAYLRSNRPVLGIEALETCLLIKKGHGLAHYNLAVALFIQGQFGEANEHLRRALEAGIQPHSQFVADLERALS